MAKLIPWEDMPEMDAGTPMWEEWRYGAKCREVCLSACLSPESYRFRSKHGGFTYGVRKGNEYRYWDAEPTGEERTRAGWEA